ncbi:uncharacterized protein A4U43_C10F3080 [Asparagus officinalis]|uniref:4a-hydroxytetrahydrobiopterin dehydratase n=1 Tax=Asparagus officinalis TaxID=4686 RepID=A0A5P1E3B7_ASPOF|nr:uncharacterized protein LOC109826096 [Asparagus officinalis]ONK55997.1 uncharacterized protein A4U43_C10F3080 [Asparagus officinalis]
MASALLSLVPTLNPNLSSSNIFHKPTTPFSTPSPSSRRRSKARSHKISAVGGDLLGDFGARDPFDAEIESNFGEKVLGYSNTEHKILIPNLSALSLSQRSCEPVSDSQSPMAREDAEKLLNKVVGWRLVEGDGGIRLQCLWKVRNYECGEELIKRINRVAEDAGYYPNLHIVEPNQVRAELWTSSIGGLSMNDFIMAAKIDEIKTMDLLPKKRVWA